MIVKMKLVNSWCFRYAFSPLLDEPDDDDDDDEEVEHFVNDAYGR